MLWRSSLRADCAVVLGPGSRRETRSVRCAHCAQTVATVLVMKDGIVVEQASAAQILAAPREDYTKRLLAAIPRGYRATA